MRPPFNAPSSALFARLWLVASVLVPVQAYAQAQTNTDSVPQMLSSLWGTKTDISVGVVAGMDQRYMGGKDFRPVVLPLISVSRGIFFADAVKGVGVQYLSASGFYIGDAFNYDPGRDNEDNAFRPGADRLRGMGDVKGTFTNTLTLSQQIVPWLSINAQAELGLDGHERGNQYQFGLESLAYHTATDALTLDLDAKMGDGGYNQTYFGVTRSQSLSSGFRHYNPGFGMYAYSLTASWNHTFTKHWTAQLVLGGTLYASKVADSPLVQRRFGIMVLPSVNYAF